MNHQRDPVIGDRVMDSRQDLANLEMNAIEPSEFTPEILGAFDIGQWPWPWQIDLAGIDAAIRDTSSENTAAVDRDQDGPRLDFDGQRCFRQLW